MSHRNLKVLYSHDIFSMQFVGGISRYIFELFIRNENAKIPLLYSENLYLNKNKKTKDFRGKVRLISALNELHERFVAKNIFDIYHISYYKKTPNRPKGAVFIVSVYDMIHEIYANSYFKNDSKTSALKRANCESCDGIIAISHTTKRDLIKFFGIDENKIRVIYLGHSLQKSQNLPQNLPQNYILFVGTRGGYKNFATFARAMVEIIAFNPQITALCVGTEFSSDEINFLQSLKIKEHFVAIQAKEDELYSIYKNALCFVFPSFYEGFGIPILESFFAECLAILSDIEVFREIAGDCAIYFNPNDAHSIANAILEGIQNENLKARKILHAKERLEMFSWESAYKQTIEFYNEVYDNLFWGNHLRCFDTTFRSMNPQVLSRSFRAKTTQSTTAITSIVASLRSQNKAKPKFLYPILRIVDSAKFAESNKQNGENIADSAKSQNLMQTKFAESTKQSQPSPPKIALIIGASGQDGYFLMKLLAQKNYIIHIFVRKVPKYEDLCFIHYDDLYFDEADSAIIYHYGDVSDFSCIIDILGKVRPNEIYNLAGISNVKISFSLPQRTADSIALGTLRILDAIKLLNLNAKFYNACSSEIFGSSDGVLNENSPFNPKSPYAIAKLYAFYMVRHYREAYNIFATNGILFNHESELRSDEFVSKKIIKAALKIAFGLQEKLYLGNLDAKRDFGYAKDYVECMHLMLQHSAPEDFIIATGRQTSIRDFCKIAFKKVGIDLHFIGSGVDEKGIDSANNKVLIEVNPNYFRPLDVKSSLGDAKKAQKILGWNPKKTSIEAMIEIMIRYEAKMLRQKMQIGGGQNELKFAESNPKFADSAIDLSLRDLPKANRGNPKNHYLDSANRMKIAESSAKNPKFAESSTKNPKFAESAPKFLRCA
ncbi:GDP-mannose 4,6-dehydratase [Helicobacter sp. 23-1044]